MTVKGKGYSPAEHNQCEWHAPGRFNPETGERIASADGRDRYQDVFGQTLVDLARLDRRVVGITPAMPSGCSMNLLLRASHPHHAERLLHEHADGSYAGSRL